MAEHQSKEIIDKISDELKVQPAGEIPKQLSKDIQYVYNVNPKNIVNMSGTVGATATGTNNFFTTPPNKDFYLTSASLSIEENSVSDNIQTLMRCLIPSGETITLINFFKLATTATSKEMSVVFNPPILLKRNSSISVTNSFTVGSAVKSGCITGFTTDPQ